MYVRCHIYKEHFSLSIYRKETINFYGYPPEWQPTFIRHVRRKLYLYVHEGNQYILAHFDLNDCDCEGLNGPFEMEGYHEEFEVCVWLWFWLRIHACGFLLFIFFLWHIYYSF